MKLFFKTRSDSFDLPSSDRHKAIRKLSGLGSRPSIDGRSPSTSTLDSEAAMPDAHKRKSLNLNSPKLMSAVPHHVPAKLTVDMESPPLVFYGPTNNSTGALLSGQLKLDIFNETLAIESFNMELVVDVKMKKPFHANCPDCTHQSTQLTKWTFLHGPATFNMGDHSFPFSFLLPGHLPITVQGQLCNINYFLRAIITPKVGESIKLTKELEVKRSIPPQEAPRQSIRIFPPTNLTAHCSLPAVVHPIGEFNMTFRIDGVIKRTTETQSQHHWKLKRLNWRVEETQKVISPACPKHAAKAGAAPGEKRGVPHEEVRLMNTEDLKSGWKCDYGGSDGSIEMEFPFSFRADSHPICDIKAEDGTEVSHSLVVEMIVAEEFAPIKAPNRVTPTGSARVLRMHFNLVLTERSGMGISWDEERPPLYEDVPASPPRYQQGETLIYEGQPIPDYDDIEALPGLS